MIISAMQALCKPIFGSFEREEFKKFLRMGVTLSCILGVYWVMRGLKASVFAQLVGAASEPYAKTASILILIPVVMLYTKILERYSREKAFYGISLFYGLATVGFSLLLANGTFGLAAKDIVVARTGLALYATQILGYLWYVFVESYGSLVIALFWAIASDTTLPESAKKGFSLVVALGQVGAIIGPKYITQLPRLLNLETSAFAVGVSSLMIFASMWLLNYFLTRTPKELLVSFHGKNEAVVEKEQEPGLFEGLKLLLQHKYLSGIFAATFFFEFIVTVFAFHFKTLAADTYTGHAYTEYLGLFGSSVNTVTLVCLLLGVSNITRYLGVTVALCLMPLVVGAAVFGFTSFNSLNFLFCLMVGSRAINYALNGPALKQLYIPTTHDARFKAQAWIETFGSRASKEGGSIFNMLYGPLVGRNGLAAGRAMHVALSSYVGYTLVFAWFFVALFLGRTFKKAVDEKRVVC